MKFAADRPWADPEKAARKVSAFANCGRAVAHIRGSYVPRRRLRTTADDNQGGD